MSEPAKSLLEVRSLLARLHEGDLDAEGYRRIEQLVRGSAAVRQLYIDSLLLDGELRWASGRPAVSEPVLLDVGIANRELAEPNSAAEAMDVRDSGAPVAGRAAVRSAGADRRSLITMLSRPLPLIGAAVAAGLLVAVGFLVYRAGADRLAVGPAELVAVAELRSDDGCVWAGKDQGVAAGTKFYAGERLELTAGVARLLFAQGATVLIESPAAFETVSATSLRLERGTVAVRASGPVKEFVVNSPDASIVDLGTSFAVHYDEESATEVEVFEGAVEVFPEADPTHGRVLEMGTNVSVGPQGKEVALVASPPEENRFAAVLERLWQDIRVVAPLEEVVAESGDVVEAEFSEAPAPDAVDVFYGAKPGRGWLTPWVAAGNPTGEILRDDPAFGDENPFLQMRFKKSHERAVAREYGRRGTFDPNLPHVISWRWRLDGKPEDFGGNFHDRVAFYGNPFFRRNSWPTNSWLVGVASDSETRGGRGSSTEWLKQERGLAADADETEGEPRRVFPMRWYFFDSQDGSAAGSVFDRRNMVDTGMPLKFGVTYHFAVVVYPQEGRYDAAIRDDEQTVVRTGLHFRDRAAQAANVFHATVSAEHPTDDRGFSLDSLRIQPLKDVDVEQQLENETAAGAVIDGE